MKSSAAPREHRSEGTQHHAVTIESSGKAFRTLIDKLYSDKIGSIVRELMTNAWDSHKMAGNLDTPFQVYSPTKIDPCFKVRDFGVGMDDKTVKDIYGVFFRSTKDKDNQAAGMYGLGGKSPWSICSMYNLTCWDGEYRREYICAIGEDDQPIVHDLGAQPDTQPRGVMVSVPAENFQFSQFEDAIRHSSLGYATPPTCNKAELIQTLPEADLSGDGWSYYRHHNHSRDQGRGSLEALKAGWFVRMGPVIYPLTASSGLKLPDLTLARHGGYEPSSILIDVPIGAVEVTSSREQIDYKKETVEALEKAIEAVQASCVRQVVERSKDIESVVEYFNTLKRITPEFARATLGEQVHPFTGVTDPYYLFDDGILFHANISDPDRGDYEEWGCTNLGVQFKGAPVFLIEASPEEFFLFDKKGGRAGKLVEDSLYTAQERRFILRQMRRVMLAHEKEHATFIFTREVSQDFLRYFYPETAFIELSLEDFRAAPIVQIKREGSGRQKTPNGVRGLRLVQKHENGGWVEPEGVTAWEEVDPEIAFFNSEDWGHRSEAVLRLAEKLELTQFYLASGTAREKIIPEGCTHVVSLLEARVKDAVDITLRDWATIYGYSFNDLKFARLFHLMRKETPKAYERLLGQRNEIARYARMLEKFAYTLRGTSLSWDMRDAERIIIYQYIKENGIEHSKAFLEASRVASAFSNDLDEHPVVEMLNRVMRGRDSPGPEALVFVPDMVRGLLAACPLYYAKVFESSDCRRNSAFDFEALFS